MYLYTVAGMVALYVILFVVVCAKRTDRVHTKDQNRSKHR